MKLSESVRTSMRSAWRERKSNLAIVLMVALGVGLNTVMFVVLCADVLHPLNYEHSERLVFAFEEGSMGAGVSLPNFRDWEAQNMSFENLALYKANQQELDETGVRKKVTVGEVSPEFFTVLRVSPSAGRNFLPSDGQLYAPRVVELSKDFWDREFHSDPRILGRILRLGGQPLEVIGIVDSGKLFASKDLWVPIEEGDSAWKRDDRTGNVVIASLKPGVTLAKAEADMTVVEASLGKTYPETDGGWHVFLQSANDAVASDARPTGYLLFLASAVVLLLTSINISGLLLVRTVKRSREFAIRMALGSTRAGIFEQLLSETLLLYLLGGTVGTLICFWGWRVLPASLPITLPVPSLSSWNTVAVAFAFGATLLAALLVALWPAWRVSRQDLAPLFNESASPLPHLSRPRLQKVVMVLQVGAAVALMICATLVTQSLLRIRHVDLGFNPHGLVVATVSPQFPPPSAEKQKVQDLQLENVLTRLAHMGQFDAIAGAAEFPLSDATTNRFAFLPDNSTKEWNTIYCPITPGYFRAMDIPMLQGRAFTEADTSEAPGVVIISQFAAQEFWPHENPIGRQLLVTGMGTETVVGVVANVQWWRDQVGYLPLQPEIYAPSAQDSESPLTSLVIRTRGSYHDACAFLRAQSAGLSNDTTSFDIKTGEQVVSRTSEPQKQYSILLGGFAALAVILAVLGIYSVFSNVVTGKTREIAIRVALGAQPRTILAMILREGLFAALLGVAGGLFGAFALTKYIRGILYEVSPVNLATYAAIAASFLLLTSVVLFSQAKRASRILPAATLRQ